MAQNVIRNCEIEKRNGPDSTRPAGLRRAACACGVALVLALCFSAPAETRNSAEHAARNLPELPGHKDAEAAGFKFDQDLVGFGYAGRETSWGAELGDYLSLDRSLTVDYGRRVNAMLGLGARLNLRNDYTETLASGVLAPARNLRLRLAAGELRVRGCCDDGAAAGNGRAQNSYLLGLKRYFGENSLLSALSYTAYSVTDRLDTGGDIAPAEAGEDDGSAGMRGWMRGHVLNLKLRPSPRSTVEFRHGRSVLASYAPQDGWDREVLAISGVRYSRYFANCLELHGRYSTTPGSQRLELDLARHRWNLSLVRTGVAGDGGLSLQIAYAIPLRGAGQAPGCGAPGAPDHSFAPLDIAASGRPALLPDKPLTVTSSDEIAEQAVAW